MSTITIRGAKSTVELPKGEEVTVEHTPAIDELIRRGFAVEVSRPERVEIVTDDDEDDENLPVVVEVPTKSSTAAQIREYLDEKGIDYASGATKPQLVEVLEASAGADENDEQ